jgi:hypothetical protein
LPWLAKLDQRARQWPRPALWGYLAFKLALVLLGGYILIGLLGERIGLWSI